MSICYKKIIAKYTGKKNAPALLISEDGYRTALIGTKFYAKIKLLAHQGWGQNEIEDLAALDDAERTVPTAEEKVKGLEKIKEFCAQHGMNDLGRPDNYVKQQKNDDGVVVQDDEDEDVSF